MNEIKLFVLFSIIIMLFFLILYNLLIIKEKMQIYIKNAKINDNNKNIKYLLNNINNIIKRIKHIETDINTLYDKYSLNNNKINIDIEEQLKLTVKYLDKRIEDLENKINIEGVKNEYYKNNKKTFR